MTYPKSVKEALTDKETAILRQLVKEHFMDNNLFDDLVASIKEAGAIKRKEIKASRVTELELPDIKEVREKTGLSQSEFAARLDS